MLGTGFIAEAKSWREWLLRAVAGDPADLQIMYGLDGTRRIPENTLDWLAAEGDDGGLTVHLVSTPRVGDRVFDRDGARLCLDEQVAQAMNGKALDAVIMPVGAITFSFQDEDR